MAAAPHLFDDLPVASPELALVDADLAAQLRADLSSSEGFRPREVARPAYLSLVFDAGAPELAEEVLPVDDEPAEMPEDAVEVTPTYVVLPDEEAEDVVVEAEVVSEVEDSVEYPVLLAPDKPTEELLDYIVRDEVVDDVVLEDVIPEVAESIDDPALPEPDETTEELPDYIVRDDEVVADGVSEPIVPEHVVRRDDVDAEHDVVQYELAEVSAEQAQSSSDYPVLPDLDERSDALEETEAALRRIREQMGSGTPTAKRRARVRRRFTVASGICAVAALALYGTEVELGILHAPSWLAF